MILGRLQIKSPDGSTFVYEITKARTTMGRMPDLDIVISSDSQISRRHLLFVSEPSGMKVIDEGSANGTFIGDIRLPANQPVPIKNGTILRVGQTIVQFYDVKEDIPGEKEVSGAPRKPIVSEEATSSQISAGNDQKQQTKPRPKPTVGINPPEIPPANMIDDLSGGYQAVDLTLIERSSYLKYLPAVYSTDDFIARFLMIFERILGPLDRQIGHLDAYLNPLLAPPEMLPWLASWLGLVLSEKWPESTRRDVISQAINLFEWRGTRHGLSEFIRLYTGSTPEIIESGDNGTVQPFHFIIKIKKEKNQVVDANMLTMIVDSEKPAHTSYSIEISN